MRQPRDAATGPASTVVLEILDPGLLATVQDAGRPHLGAEGITRGGAADTWSLAVANLLVGNARDAAALEMTLLGARVRARCRVTVGTGGTMAARIVETGVIVPPGTSITLREGWTLSFEPAVDGVRGYLAVPGGIDVPVVLGSRSTALAPGFGGHEGRAMRAGDEIRAAAAPDRLAPPPLRWPGPPRLPAASAGPLRVLPGPHARGRPLDAHPSRPVDGPPADALDALARSEWTVDARSDRVGLRLDGPPLPGHDAGELASHGVLPGSVQVPPDRLPIVLHVDHQPTGGYPVIAVVIAADLPRLGQLGPGTPLRFETATHGEALHALREREDAIADAADQLRDAARWEHLAHDARG